MLRKKYPELSVDAENKHFMALLMSRVDRCLSFLEPWLTQLWSWCDMRPVLCSDFMNEAACDRLLQYQCQPVDACSWVNFSFFFISMSSVFLSTEVCFLNGASQC